MGFQHGLSGLSAASTNLDVIGNNIANANTVGFKQSETQFSDVYANSLSGASGNQVGIGVKIADIAQQFTQGNITGSSNPLDMAINGDGFFRMSDNGAINYSRNGQFHVDKDGFIVNANDMNLTGFIADTNGNIIAAAPANLSISTADLSPQSTTAFRTGFNLDSRAVVPAVIPPFLSTDPTTYTSTTSGQIFDSLGNSHVLSLYFQKTAANTWETYATVDGAPNVTLADLPADPAGPSVTITFDTNGLLVTPTGLLDISVDLATIDPTLGATSPLNFTLDIAEATQFGTNFGVNSLTQDGYSSGRIASFGVSGDGVILGNYTNGETRTLGQVILASFANPQGLAPLGDNLFAETPQSGQPLVGAPQTGTLGSIQESAVEDSNVDLTTELVKMITAQRTYQANAKTIETQDAILQTLVNL